MTDRRQRDVGEAHAHLVLSSVAHDIRIDPALIFPPVFFVHRLACHVPEPGGRRGDFPPRERKRLAIKPLELERAPAARQALARPAVACDPEVSRTGVGIDAFGRDASA